MPKTILVVGATGNTGRSVVHTLSSSIKNTAHLADHQILALTRTRDSPAAQSLGSLPNVQVLEKAWLEITPSWLREHNVERAFIASHNEPSHFAEESTFLLAARDAGVEYVVRISTTAANVKPDCEAYYPRAHWAVEAMLSTPEFGQLKWTSLQPAVFTTLWVSPAVEMVKRIKKDGAGKQSETDVLKLMAAEDGPCACIHPDDVGSFAGTLLLLPSSALDAHNGQRYEINGPEDVTGRELVALVEKEVGAKVQARFKELSLVEEMLGKVGTAAPLVRSVFAAPKTSWDGQCVAGGTSEGVRKLRAPRIGVEETFRAMLEGA